jgi:hypothetical protein
MLRFGAGGEAVKRGRESAAPRQLAGTMTLFSFVMLAPAGYA